MWPKKDSDKINFGLVIITLISVIITGFSFIHTKNVDAQIIDISNKSIDLSNKSIELSKQALCLQKDAEYRDIAPPSIVVNLKEGRIFKDDRTANMIFRFHLIPNSKTFFYPDANFIGDISNFSLGGFKDNSDVYYLDNNGNIITLDEHVDRIAEVFFMRIEWELEGFQIPREKIGDFFNTLIATKYSMTWKLYFSDIKPRMALYVSKLSHCLYDILSRVHSGEWDVDIPLIISNHRDLQPVALQFGIPFYHFEKNRDNSREKEQFELSLLKEHKVDFIVLARYMQVLSEYFISIYPDKIINIHHSFLPAFPGAKPYHSAYERGVKIIGATSHYVTCELDAGPIIDQDVIRITHRDSIDSLIRKGKDVEKLVLSRAILMHLQRRTMVYNNRTIVFG